MESGWRLEAGVRSETNCILLPAYGLTPPACFRCHGTVASNAAYQPLKKLVSVDVLLTCDKSSDGGQGFVLLAFELEGVR